MLPCISFSTTWVLSLGIYALFHRTALLCSLSRTALVLPVSPIYVSSQLQSTLYTTSITFASAGLLFTLFKMVRSVLCGLRSLQDLSMLTLRSRTCGRHRYYFCFVISWLCTVCGGGVIYSPSINNNVMSLYSIIVLSC